EEASVLVAGPAPPRARAVADRVLGGAERLEHAQAVLVDVDAGAGGAQAVGALVHPHTPAALRERAGGGQACETAADNLRAALHVPQNRSMDLEQRIARFPRRQSKTITYRETGAGQALVLLHGIGSASAGWLCQLESLAGYRLNAWGAPGYGDAQLLSGTPPRPALFAQARSE